MSDKKGTRLPNGWKPGPEFIEYAIGLGFTAHEARAVGEDFYDYWVSAAGQKGVKLDWLATWRTWTRREANRQDKQPPREPVDIGEPMHAERQRWQTASGQQLELYKRMSEKGCPDDVLDQLYTEGCGICYPDNEKPTAVFRSGRFHEVWTRAASGYAKRAGYNECLWHHQFYEYYRKKQKDIKDGKKRIVSGKWVNADQDPRPEPNGGGEAGIQQQAEMAPDHQDGIGGKARDVEEHNLPLGG